MTEQRVRFSATLTKSMHEFLKKESAARGISINALLNVLLNEQKEKLEKK